MSTGRKLKIIGIASLLSSTLLYAEVPPAGSAAPAQVKRQSQKARNKKKPADPPPPLPSGPTGRPVQPVPLDAIAAVPPQVTFENNQLTIIAPNSTLADILHAVHKLTGADIEIPAAPERVVTHLGPGPAREVVADLLNGSRFNYVLLGSPGDESALTRVVLVAKTGSQQVTPNPMAQNTPPPPQGQIPGQMANQVVEQPEADPAADANEAEATDDGNNTADENAEQQPAEAEQQNQTPDQNGIKTPQQMLQEMQQRQMQLQQQQQPGQPPVPGSGMPPHPPQEDK